jgi:hypothetical protein
MDYSKLCIPGDHAISRRRWLGNVAAGVGSVAGMGLLSPQSLAETLSENVAKQNKQVLFMWLDGGISQLESWDPKPKTQFGGPFRAIPTSVPGIHISELMPKTAEQMHHVAVIRSLQTQDQDHSSGVPRIQRGDPQNRGVVYPYLGSAMTRLLPYNDNGLPPYVVIKPGNGGFFHKDAGFLGAKYGAVAFGDGSPPTNVTPGEQVAEQDMLARASLLKAQEQAYAAKRPQASTEANTFVFEMASKLMKRVEVFDQATFSPKDVERYGDHDLGRHTLLARRMLEEGVSFVKVLSYGWDTHGDNFNAHHNMVPRFDQAFAAVVQDLDQRGMLDNVLVIAMSEFGRTPRINGHLGRDHWPAAWSLAMAGCGVKKGICVGQTNALGTDVKTEPYDIGHMFHTWFQALGINSAKTEYDNNGQPLPIAHGECHAVKELLA